MTRLHNKSQWHCRARRQLQREPLCAMCLAEGKVVAARIADHIEPYRNDAVKFWNGALQSLCAHCHESRKKFIEHCGFDKAIGADGMPIDPRHPVRIPGAAAQTRVVSMGRNSARTLGIRATFQRDNLRRHF